jgi:hypothetical protein
LQLEQLERVAKTILDEKLAKRERDPTFTVLSGRFQHHQGGCETDGNESAQERELQDGRFEIRNER